MIKKLAYNIEMAFSVPDSEKKVATIAIELLNHVIAKLQLASDHLDLMYDPFKKNENISSEALSENRGILNRFKQAVKENYEEVKNAAAKSLAQLNYFSSDTSTLEITNAFKDSISDVEKATEILLKVLDEYESPEFRTSVLAAIEGIKKQSIQVEKLIKERIIDHLDANILAKDWMANSAKGLELKLEDKVPFITQLYRERQQALESLRENAFPAIEKRPQAMNPSDIESMQFPDDLSPKLTGN